MLTHIKKGWNVVATNWQVVVISALVTIALAGLYSFKLGTLVPGYAPEEVAAVNSSRSVQAIANNPVNAPHKVPQYLLLKLQQRSIIAMRAVSVLFAVVTVWLFYAVLSRWHTKRVAIFGTTLLATTSFMLHNARLATPNILLTALFAVICCGLFIRYSQDKSRAWLLTSLVVGMSLYIPFMIWFIVLGALWQLRSIKTAIKSVRKLIIITCIAIIVACAIPIIIALVRSPDIWHELTGIPYKFPPFIEILKNIGQVPLLLFVRSPINPVYWLGRFPLLDIFISIMVIFGTYSYLFKIRLHRTQMLIVVGLVGTILVGISAQFEQVLLIFPFVYIIATAGIALLLQQWFTVFPRNPIARSLGLSIMIVAISMAIGYQLINYFVAWPNNPTTKITFSIKA